LTNRYSELDSLIESIEFKKLDKEDLLKLYQKKKWIHDHNNFLNKIIAKDIEDDESGSESDKSGSDSDSD
jgi:hypothetical protein